MFYRYKAYSESGNVVTETIVAKNKDLARAELESRGWTVEKIQVDIGAAIKGALASGVGGVGLKDLLVMTRNLSVMMHAGMTLDDSLSILSEQSSNPAVSKILNDVNEGIRSGKTLAEGLGEYPKVFSNVYVNIVSAAEQGGTLDTSLNQLAVQLQKSYDLRTRVRNALFYPVLVIVSTMIVGVVLSIIVLPKVTRLFASFDAELPLTTRMVIGFSDLLTNQTLLLVAIVLAIVVGVLIFTRSAIFRPIWHRLLLRIPVFGKISHYYNIALFSRTLHTMLSSGVPINQALTITSETVSNLLYKKALIQIVQDQQSGETLGNLLREYPHLFPPLVYRMLSVGEESGNLEDTLQFTSEFFEDEIDSITKNLSTIMEPLLLVVIGIAVAIVALGIITPIYQITGSFQFN